MNLACHVAAAGQAIAANSGIGKIETLVYEQAANKAISPETSEMEEIRQKLDELLRLTQKRNKPYHKPPYHTEKKGERNDADAE